MVVSRSEVFGLALLFLCISAMVMLVLVEWKAEHRIKLGVVLFIIACCAVLGMYP